jgi:hypothetical protein
MILNKQQEHRQQQGEECPVIGCESRTIIIKGKPQSKTDDTGRG